MNDASIQDLDVVLKSRVRLARNYRDLPFFPKMTDQTAETVVARAMDALDGEASYQLLRIRDLPDAERKRLVERHLISYDLLKFPDWAAALIDQSENVSVMLNEEDHLRIQGLLPGLALEGASDLAFQMDDTLMRNAPYAFDPQWGYLTSFPTNVGTGMRASVLLHLPALHEGGLIGGIVQSVSKLGMIVRGQYGEGSEASGCLYQLSNQVTLGRTEEDILRSLIAATLQITDHERAIRAQVLESDAVMVRDKLMRSVGILSHAHLLSLPEFMARMSDLRLAAALNLVEYPLLALDELACSLQDGALESALGTAVPRALLAERARRMRAFLTS